MMQAVTPKKMQILRARRTRLLYWLILVVLLLFSASLGISFHHKIGKRLAIIRHDLAEGRAKAADDVDSQQPLPLPLKYPLWWAAPFYSDSGYGSEAISYVLGLAQGFVRPQDLWLTQSGGNRADEDVSAPEVTELLAALDYEKQKQVLNASELQRPAVVICHSFPDCWQKPDEESYPPVQGSPCPTTEMQSRVAYRVGRTMFETDRLPQHLVDHLRAFDEIWVPTEFNRQTFSASGFNASKIFILPESINLTEFDPTRHRPKRVSDVPFNSLAIGTPRAADKAGKPFVFLSIFKWEARKGWDILLKAFLEEFKGDEDVELHISTHPFMESVEDWGLKVRQGLAQQCGYSEFTDWAKFPRVFVSGISIPGEHFPKLYKGADALVVPTRGEGWGRPQMEAMAMELPVISTNWSGLTTFLNSRTGYPIEVEGLVEAKADGPNFFAYFTGTKWAQPSGAHLQQLMRHVVTHREEARAKGKAARRYLQRHFSPQAVARALHRLVLDMQLRADAHVRALASGG